MLPGMDLFISKFFPGHTLIFMEFHVKILLQIIFSGKVKKATIPLKIIRLFIQFFDKWISFCTNSFIYFIFFFTKWIFHKAFDIWTLPEKLMRPHTWGKLVDEKIYWMVILCLLSIFWDFTIYRHFVLV